MASKPQSSSAGDNTKEESASQGAESRQARLPFEPGQNRKKAAKKAAAAPATTVSKAQDNQKVGKSTLSQRAFTGVPEDVSKRMARRMALFCGIPTGLGILTFVVSYFIVSQHLFKLPTVAVFLVSLGFFGLGVLGLSYGAFSASWDEGRIGSWLGFSEFKVNVGRAIASWKESQQRAS